MNLLLHPATAKQLQEIVAARPQSILVVGPAGSGKTALSKRIMADVLGITEEQLAYYPYLYHLGQDVAVITIEDVRALHGITRLKTPGTHGIRRAILVENAQNMTHEAQNATLKLLEEPPNDTVIILTATEKSALLPTIISRLTPMQLQSVSLQQATEYFEELGYSVGDIKKAFYISGGAPGLMVALLSGKGEHPLMQYIDDAKQLLAASKFERLAAVDKIAADKQAAIQTLQALERICQAGILQAAEAGKADEVATWSRSLKLTLESMQNATRNAQPKLLLTNLMINL